MSLAYRKKKLSQLDTLYDGDSGEDRKAAELEAHAIAFRDNIRDDAISLCLPRLKEAFHSRS